MTFGNVRSGLGSTSPNIWSDGTYQYCVVVRRDWYVIVYKRPLDSFVWTGYNLGLISGNPMGVPIDPLDDHKVFSISVDGLGHIHIMGNTHAEAHNYVVSRDSVSSGSFDLTAWNVGTVPDTGSGGNFHTYDQVVALNDGTLLWFFDQQESIVSYGRDWLMFRRGPAASAWLPWTGVSGGNGELVVSDAQGVPTDPDRVYIRNVYVDAANVIHVHGIWRVVDADPTSQTDPFYIKSTNGGTTWLNASGAVMTMPLHYQYALTHCTVANNGEPSSAALGGCTDNLGRTHTLMNGNGGLQHYWWNGSGWSHETLYVAGAKPGTPAGRVYWAALGNGFPNLFLFDGHVWAIGESGTQLRATNLDTGDVVRMGYDVPKDTTGPPDRPFGPDTWFPHIDRNRLKAGVVETMVPDGDAPKIYTHGHNARVRYP